YVVLSPLLLKYPRSGGSLFQAYNDIVYVQRWNDVEALDLRGCQRGVIKGRKKDSETPSFVIPCSLMETLSFSWFKDAFTELSRPAEIYLAVTSDDASLVYYKISNDIVKPGL
ncbi:tRNA intron endonuclease, partial [Amanita muscaria]